MAAVTHRRLPWLVALMSALVSAAIQVTHAQQPQQSPSTFRIVRVAAGPRGAEVGGQFRLEQERMTFNRSSDTQVVVHFQWEGAPGIHRLAARWRSPTGGLAISEIDYHARDRLFGAYWTLPISPSAPLGSWSIEATIDGLPGGVFTFEIVDGDIPTSAVSRSPLSPSELYQRLDSVYVSIERSATRDGLIDRNGGFVIGRSSIVTAFSALDAADTLEMMTGDGARLGVTSLALWDRHQDWAIIPATTKVGPALPRAAADSTKVGDRCYSMESGASGLRVLVECAIVGRTAADVASTRFIVQFVAGRGVPGSPVLNEFGEVVGMIGGPPSPTFRGMPVFGTGADPGSPVVPVSAIGSFTTEQVVSIQDLKRRGVLMLAVGGRDNILIGGFARQILRNPIRPIDQREQFSQADGRFSVFLRWDPKERVRGTIVYRIYNEDNQTVMESKPRKVDFKPGTGTFSQQEVPVPQTPGSYRADVLIGEVPMWRGFFRVTP